MHFNKKKAFTLIELLVVIAILLTLVALLGPSFKRLHLRALQAKGLRNLQQMGGAQFAFSDDFRFLTPYIRAGVNDFDKPIPPNNITSGYWPITMMPYLGNQVDIFWRPDTDPEPTINTKEADRYIEYKQYAPFVIKLSYWMNCNHAKAPFAVSFRQIDKPYMYNIGRVSLPSHCIGLTGGVAWTINDDRNHRWEDGKTDILWLDGHADFQYLEDILNKNYSFDYK